MRSKWGLVGMMVLGVGAFVVGACAPVKKAPPPAPGPTTHSATFLCENAPQTWVVPTGVTKATFSLAGGGGGGHPTGGTGGANPAGTHGVGGSQSAGGPKFGGFGIGGNATEGAVSGGGGGGGGLYGGGGGIGDGDGNVGGGGGGGSSFGPAGAQFQNGVYTGQGVVVITWVT